MTTTVSAPSDRTSLAAADDRLGFLDGQPLHVALGRFPRMLRFVDVGNADFERNRRRGATARRAEATPRRERVDVPILSRGHSK